VLVGVDKDGWPVEVETLDKNATNLTRVELTNIRTNQAVDDKAFSLKPIDDTWNKVDESYRG
jgi:outer membrane lipoprotein-sorting protein